MLIPILIVEEILSYVGLSLGYEQQLLDITNDICYNNVAIFTRVNLLTLYWSDLDLSDDFCRGKRILVLVKLYGKQHLTIIRDNKDIFNGYMYDNPIVLGYLEYDKNYKMRPNTNYPYYLENISISDVSSYKYKDFTLNFFLEGLSLSLYKDLTLNSDDIYVLPGSVVDINADYYVKVNGNQLILDINLIPGGSGLKLDVELPNIDKLNFLNLVFIKYRAPSGYTKKINSSDSYTAKRLSSLIRAKPECRICKNEDLGSFPEELDFLRTKFDRQGYVKNYVFYLRCVISIFNREKICYKIWRKKTGKRKLTLKRFYTWVTCYTLKSYQSILKNIDRYDLAFDEISMSKFKELDNKDKEYQEKVETIKKMVAMSEKIRYFSENVAEYELDIDPDKTIDVGEIAEEVAYDQMPITTSLTAEFSCEVIHHKTITKEKRSSLVGYKNRNITREPFNIEECYEMYSYYISLRRGRFSKKKVSLDIFRKYLNSQTQAPKRLWNIIYFFNTLIDLTNVNFKHGSTNLKNIMRYIKFFKCQEIFSMANVKRAEAEKSYNTTRVFCGKESYLKCYVKTRESISEWAERNDYELFKEESKSLSLIYHPKKDVKDKSVEFKFETYLKLNYTYPEHTLIAFPENYKTRTSGIISIIDKEANKGLDSFLEFARLKITEVKSESETEMSTNFFSQDSDDEEDY
jgi:hypothetical protein